MVQYFITIIQSFLANHGSLAVFVLSFLDAPAFFIPSYAIFPAFGFFMIDPHFSFFQALFFAFFKIAIWSAAGEALGSLVLYTVAYFGGKPLILRLGRYVGVSWEQVEEIRNKFTAGYADEVTLFGLRALPIFPLTPVCLFCGLIRLDLRTFVSFTFLGLLFRVTFFSMIGWVVGEMYYRYAVWFGNIDSFLTSIIVIIAAAFIIRRILKKRRAKFLKK